MTAPRQLPRNDDAERTILGAILINSRVFFDVAGKLRTDHFAHPVHGAIFAAIQALATSNRPIDPLTVQAACLVKEVTFGHLTALTDGIPSTTNIGYYAGLVINASKLRAAIKRADAIIESAHQATADAREVIEQAQAGYFALSDDTHQKSLWFADEMTAELYNHLEGSELPGATPQPPIATGLPSLDAMFEGFGAGDLAFIGGRPSTGKTALVNQIAVRAAQERMTLVCSLEMKHNAIWKRALANQARVEIPQHRRKRFSEGEQQSIGRAMGTLGGLQLAIEDMPNGTDMDVLAVARRVQMQRGLGLVVVDYLQLMSAAQGEWSGNRGNELGAITRALKRIAMTLDVPVIVLAALSRAAQNERPNMSHIRECGTAEFDADHIFLMHRDVQAQKEILPGHPSPAELIIAKQRNGPTGDIPLLYFGEFYRFESQAVA